MARKTQYTANLLGHRVCNKAFKALLGVGSGRIDRVRKGLADLRFGPRPTGPYGMSFKAKRTHNIMEWFWVLYHQEGEGLPNKFKFVLGERKPLAQSTTTADNDMHEHGLGPVDSDEEERIVGAAQLYLAQDTWVDGRTRVGPTVFRGPRRYIAATRIVYLWYQYLSWADAHGKKRCGYSTFVRAVHFVFGRVKMLGFRKSKGEHPECTACAGFKKELKQAKSIAERQAILDEYLHTQRTKTQTREETLSAHVSGNVATRRTRARTPQLPKCVCQSKTHVLPPRKANATDWLVDPKLFETWASETSGLHSVSIARSLGAEVHAAPDEAVDGPPGLRQQSGP